MTEVATEAFRAIGRGEEIPNHSVVPYYLNDLKTRISIARVGGRLYAFDDLCTCADAACPLSGGLLTDATIMCQCHGSRFDITSGAVINGPATRALTVYEVQEVDGSIRIRPQAHDAGTNPDFRQCTVAFDGACSTTALRRDAHDEAPSVPSE